MVVVVLVLLLVLMVMLLVSSCWYLLRWLLNRCRSSKHWLAQPLLVDRLNGASSPVRVLEIQDGDRRVVREDAITIARELQRHGAVEWRAMALVQRER